MSRELKSGKMQFNVKSAKNFRDTLSKWHNADFELAVALDKKSGIVKGYKTIIATNNELIEKLDNGEKSVMKSREELVAEITDFEGRIAHENKIIAELREVQKSRLESAYALLSKDLHKAYCDYIQNGLRDEYAEQLCVFFEQNGITPTMAIFDFVASIGIRKATTKQKIESAKHTTNMAYTQWRDLFLGFLCDTMGDALPIDKFIYKTMEERQKAWEENKKNK